MSIPIMREKRQFTLKEVEIKKPQRIGAYRHLSAVIGAYRHLSAVIGAYRHLSAVIGVNRYIMGMGMGMGKDMGMVMFPLNPPGD